jgi:hypothetical protein
MSNVSLVYQGLIQKVSGLFPDKTRIPNPYNLQDNIDKLLCDGFGIKVGPESGSEYAEFNSFTVSRTFSVVLTREMVATSSDSDVPDDISLKLLEDIYEARKMIFGPEKMGLSSILNVSIGSSDGVNEVKSGQRKFLSTEFSFSIDINENF